MTERVYNAIIEKACRTLAAGHSAILDAVFARPAERMQAERAAGTIGTRFEGLFLEADVETRARRAGTRARDASDANAEVARVQESYDLGALTWHRVDASGKPGGFPVNPNGSQGDIGGLCDATGRVLGLMPHPERHVLPTQHPRWTRLGLAAEGDGLLIFRNAVQFFK